MSRERTFIAVKPDGVHRGLTGEIIRRFEAKGLKMVAMKFLQPTEEFAKQHYDDLKAQPFFDGLCKFMSCGPVVAMVWEGSQVILTGRKMMGETHPFESAPGTIRGDLCVEIARNIIHGSDSEATAAREIALWFKPEELVTWTQSSDKWVYE